MPCIVQSLINNSSTSAGGGGGGVLAVFMMVWVVVAVGIIMSVFSKHTMQMVM